MSRLTTIKKFNEEAITTTLDEFNEYTYKN